ncbi:PREDICTED: polyadenylate-binding protein 1-like isoform X2 [Lupinus angustifolius]|uniref:polyadenylate-binding protein 1-like isoform X2 n=1 Tax=Lupinus angustifolius TaxID=3871 RepID=UPI00092F2A5A|nr:PREDICTED: polyadenylate-binding protein 1-like isoform X2 [Lupinus angustifolius]XP_019435551.1 PREDICTED: polyadenylate-binding protein 1-like isoform X2 [Lupinus angustifolius]
MRELCFNGLTQQAEMLCHNWSLLRRLLSRLNMETAKFSPNKGSFSSSASHAEKEEVDSRSIYVGNVDYACTAQELRRHFERCGIVNRVTIPVDKYGHPKGFAYVEFVDIHDVPNALSMNESILRGRKLKVSAKRTNIPGMKQYYRRTAGFRSRRPFAPSPPYRSDGHGRVATFRRPMRYRPY